jgi:alpha-tubulin suppressor-like RCC1 family protein
MRMGAGTCTCTSPNEGAPCQSATDCTGDGKCEHSAQFRSLVANVAEIHGTRGSQKEIICPIPPVSEPTSVEGFSQRQSDTKQYKGIARMFVKVKIHDGQEFSAKSLIYHYYDPPTVTNVYPNSASNRGGSRITVTGTLFKRETVLSTIRNPDDTEDSLRDMEITCRLHHSLKSQPGTFVNSTHVYCQTNRVCIEGSTMSGCQNCILEGCAAPVLDYSHSLPTNTFFAQYVALNDQDFSNDKIPFYVYSITSFRPFGGVYNGGTHVSIAGINFDRGGLGPYDAHCRFARIVVPARYDPVQQLIKCLSQPLLDIYTVLEVHLGANLSDTTLWTDDRNIFNMYTAYPPGLAISPDSGSFTGKQPLRFSVPTPHQFNHFRFRSFDFDSKFQSVEASLLVQGQSGNDPRTDFQLITLGRIISMELNLYMCVTEQGCDSDDTCVRKCKIGTQHCIWERICHLSRDCQCRYPNMLFPTYVEDSDVVFGYRRNLDDQSFELSFRIEPTDEPEKIKLALQDLLNSGVINQMIHSDWVEKSTVILNHPTLAHLNITAKAAAKITAFFSEYAAFARFGPLVTEGWASELVALEAEIATSPVDSPATVQVSFCMNGQQFSLQPIPFYYYTVTRVVPFGVPTKIHETDEWDPCKFQIGNETCQSTYVKDKTKDLATIRIYGNNFRQSRQVQGAIYKNPKCRYGSYDDVASGVQDCQLGCVDGVINYEFGFVECPQPIDPIQGVLKSKTDGAVRIRVEVALNGRDFSYSALDENGPQGLLLYEEPELITYEPSVGPITGGTKILITGKRFRQEASDCFCLFSVVGGIKDNEAWTTVRCTVLSDTKVECYSPPFSKNRYGYAASTFKQPPQSLPIYVTLNGHHWHWVNAAIEGPRFSLFDVRSLTPRMSSIEGFSTTVQVNLGNFNNPNKMWMFCWFKVPGSTPNGDFVFRGFPVDGDTGLYTCDTPLFDSLTIDGQKANKMFPCNPLQKYEDAKCNLDGSLVVPFGVAFAIPSTDKSSLKETDFSLTQEYTFYARPRFYDFLPKMGDQMGGTEIQIYGEGFLELPSLRCKFEGGVSEQFATKTIFKSPNLVVCVTPKKTLMNLVTVKLSVNNVHWMTCGEESLPDCKFNHPYYNNALRTCCQWEGEQVTQFSYARRPSLSALQPNAAPTQGDTELKIIGNNIVTGITGIVYACLIDGNIIRGDFKEDGGLQYMTCLTRPNMKVGELEVKISINRFEWSVASQILYVFEPPRVLRLNPSFTMWDDPIAQVTIIGKNFITPDQQIGSLIVRFAEFDEDGVVKWKKDLSPFQFGPSIEGLEEPALEPNIITDVITIEPPKRSPCTRVGARFCEPGVINVFVSQNEGTEWTSESITFTYIRQPSDLRDCFGGISNDESTENPSNNQASGFCALEAQLGYDGSNMPITKFIDKHYNRRGECMMGGEDDQGQAARSGTCVCTSSDCTNKNKQGAYDCGDGELGGIELGCSIKAAITDVSPRSGPITGGTFVQIRGHKINNGFGYWCKFGTQTVQATLNTSNDLVECITPPFGVNGSVEVEISISAGEGEDPALMKPVPEWTVSHGHHTFHYYWPPSIVGLEPSIGPASGGTKIRVTAGMTDALMALDTRYRAIDVDDKGSAICTGDRVGGLCRGMWLFGSYTRYGPISPGYEVACVREPHCEYELYQQHDLTCRFCSKSSEYCFESVDTTYLEPNVIQCITQPHQDLTNDTVVSYEDMTVEVTMNGQLWHKSPVDFRVHAWNNITQLYPEAGPAIGGTWITLVGTGFIESHLTVCKFGARRSLKHRFVNKTHFACQAPPNTVLEAVDVGISFNGVQYEFSQQRFEYIAEWKLKRLFPQFAREVGGAELTIIGSDFKDVSAIACKFGNHIVKKPYAVYISPNEIQCRVPENILKRPTFVTNPESCDGTYVQGTTRADTGWTACRSCTNCCECPDCPDCLPACKCRQQGTCCTSADPSDDREFAAMCPPSPALQYGQPRSLCLPPEYSCQFVSTDETTKVLECTLLEFKGVLHPEMGTTEEFDQDDFLHPDLALRLTLPFHLALDGQSWYSGCVSAPFLGNEAGGDEEYEEPPCITEDNKDEERWYGTFTYVEKPNITRFKPAIAPNLGGTPITIIGEGFVDSTQIKCRFGFMNDGKYDPDFPLDENGNLVGVEPNEVKGTFVDPFTVICISPPLDEEIYDGLTKGENAVAVDLQISCNGLIMEYSQSEVDFVYSKPWELTKIEPRNSPSIGGASITFFGPYFYDSGEIQCKFGDLFATNVTRVNDGEVVCRSPSVNIHQVLNVSITVDGTTWSDFHNKSIIEYFGVRNVLTFGENDYGQLGFGVVGERRFNVTRCSGGKYGKLECSSDVDCPSGNCVDVDLQANREPSFLKELFARNMTGIAMGQTHTLIISSETYSDDWGTKPRRGVVYTWGDNLVGQMAHGFAGPSYKQYNFALPTALVCLPSETYMLDRRLDSSEIIGLPDDWPEDGWIVPTCIRTQDVKTEGLWRVSTFVLYNPFYYKSIIRIAAGSFHSMAITEDLDLYIWGWNNDGQLGLGPLDLRPNVAYPTQVLYFRRKLDIKADIVKVSAGFAHSAALDSQGRLFTWGNNKYGQLGLGDYLSRRYPTEVTGFIDPQGVPYKISDVQCGLYHCVVLTEIGTVWSFGSNSRGQLGTCDSIPILSDDMNLRCEEPTPVMDNEKVFSRNIPKMVEFLEISDYAGITVGRPLITKIATGSFHTLAIGSPCAQGLLSRDDPCPLFDRLSGDLYVWGNNKYGQLGIGSYSDMTYKQLPYLLRSLSTISARCREGETSDCVNVEDYSRRGKKITNIGAGSWHSILVLEQKERIAKRRAYKAVNRMYTFGNNDEGQLGQGDLLLRDLPTQLVTNFVKFHELGGNFYQSIFTQGCPPHDALVCNGNGMCREEGICDCYPGYKGEDCSIECDGGADNVCSGHGNNTLAIEIAKWRQQVILAASGHALKTRLDRAFTGYSCEGALSEVNQVLVNKTKRQEMFTSKNVCDKYCSQAQVRGTCNMAERRNISSPEVVALLERLVADYPAMSTAVQIVRDDWPLHMYNQGLRYWKYAHHARGEYLKSTTAGPSDGSWTKDDLYPLLTMLQNRSTCWRSYSCQVGLCSTDIGYTRVNPGESSLDVNPGCRDGWTAQQHFRKRIEEIDQAWSNLELENPYCEPQVIADKYELRKEQVQYIWAAFATDPENVTQSMLKSSHPNVKKPILGDPIQKVRQVWDAFDIHCQNYTIAQISLGCMLDGSCTCSHGWTGTDCSIECKGGAKTPCNWHGTCDTDGGCLCERGWTGPACEIECDGAKDNPDHWPCNLHGHCNGWFVNPKTQLHMGPTRLSEEKYFSIGKGISFFEIGTNRAENGTCHCHYGFRSEFGKSDCAVRCPGTEPTFVDEKGECFDNGVCNMTGDIHLIYTSPIHLMYTRCTPDVHLMYT